jgi:hypothetical protein
MAAATVRERLLLFPPWPFRFQRRLHGASVHRLLFQQFLGQDLQSTPVLAEHSLWSFVLLGVDAPRLGVDDLPRMRTELAVAQG